MSLPLHRSATHRWAPVRLLGFALALALLLPLAGLLGTGALGERSDVTAASSEITSVAPLAAAATRTARRLDLRAFVAVALLAGAALATTAFPRRRRPAAVRRLATGTGLPLGGRAPPAQA